MDPAQRLSELTESVIREMTRLAIQNDAINLSQGFPDFDPSAELLAAGVEALRRGFNQYTISWRSPRLPAALTVVDFKP